VKLREGRLAKKTRRLTSVLRWEPLLGVGVLVCVGLMNVFAGTLSPIATAAQQSSNGKNQPFNTSVRTTDNKFTVTLNVNPNRFGTNVFTVTVVDNSTHKTTTNVGVALYTTMLDMDMGTDNVNLLPDGKGHFSASGDLAMAGDWQIRIQIRTPDNTLHEATVKLVTPF
jgi:nitrogen fixation protein FixH